MARFPWQNRSSQRFGGQQWCPGIIPLPQKDCLRSRAAGGPANSFNENPYPTFRTRQDLALKMGVPESRIRVWFQNRRNRTRGVQQGPEGSAGTSGLASPQSPKEPGARARDGRNTRSGRTRLRTRLTSAQLDILLEAFRREPVPGHAARVYLAQLTELTEDTVYIWFQNRRARHPAGGRGRVRGQDSPASPASPAPNGGPEGPCAREIEQQRAQDSPLRPAAATAAGLGVHTWSLPSPPTSSFPVSSPAVAQPPGPFQDTADEDHDDNDDSQPHPVARNTCPVDTKDIEFCLDQLLAELEADQPSQDTLDPDVAWEPIDQTLELPLEEQVYQALLQALL
ncbi:hypothetical protein STEG23_038167 [Scotinomys teguina]